MLQDSGIEFVEVPQLDVRKPSTSWKARGRGRFHVDLLVPSPDDTFPIVPVPELQAHPMGLPYLRYLLGDAQMALLAAREGCCQVRVPTPERFVVQKMAVSQLRGSRTAKSDQDLLQASVLLAVLAEHHPGAVEAALEHLPTGASGAFSRALPLVQPLLEEAHPRAWETIAGYARA